MGNRENANVEKRNNRTHYTLQADGRGETEKDWLEETVDLGMIRKVNR